LTVPIIFQVAQAIAATIRAKNTIHAATTRRSIEFIPFAWRMKAMKHKGQ